MPVLAPSPTHAARLRHRWMLSLDVGEASIGWAVGLVDAEGRVAQLVNTGVTLFQSAWSNDNGTYVAHGAADRVVRGAQQRHESSGRRLADLARLFAAALDRTAEDVKALTVTARGGDPRAVFALRAAAARKPLPAADLFRVLHHMAAHRGIRLAELQVPDEPTVTDDETPDPTGDDDTRRAAADERAFRRLMAEHLRRHGVQPTCGEIMDRRLRDTPAGSQPVTRARDGVHPGGGVAVPTPGADRARVRRHPHDAGAAPSRPAVEPPAPPDPGSGPHRRPAGDAVPVPRRGAPARRLVPGPCDHRRSHRPRPHRRPADPGAAPARERRQPAPARAGARRRRPPAHRPHILP